MVMVSSEYVLVELQAILKLDQLGVKSDIIYSGITDDFGLV